MKKLILLITLLIFATGTSQILNPVKWSTSVHKLSDKEFELVATAFIDDGWHLYSQNVPEDGPIATTFSYKGSNNYLKKGNTVEEKGHTINDPIFGMEITYFETKTIFKQKIRTKTKKPFTIEGTVEFMVCDDSKCLPPTEVDLIFNIK